MPENGKGSGGCGSRISEQTIPGCPGIFPSEPSSDEGFLSDLSGSTRNAVLGDGARLDTECCDSGIGVIHGATSMVSESCHAVLLV